MKRNRNKTVILSVAAMTVILLCGSGCSTPRGPGHYYFQRDPVRVAIIPSSNATPEPSAPIVFNKVCEDMLRKRGFEVISADRVVTYASSSGLTLRDIPGLQPGRLGADLKADYLLYSKIDVWATRYHVVNGSSEVAGSCWMVESATGALVWQAGWHEQNSSGNGGGGIIGILVEAAVTAAVNSAIDVCAQMGSTAAIQTIHTLPSPGFEPLERPPVAAD
jgi:hypothetical protein